MTNNRYAAQSTGWGGTSGTSPQSTDFHKGTNLRLTFSERSSKSELRIRGAGLLASVSRRYLPALSPTYSRRYRRNVNFHFSELRCFKGARRCSPRRVERFVRTCNGLCPDAWLRSEQRNCPTEVHGRVPRNSRWIARCASTLAAAQTFRHKIEHVFVWLIRCGCPYNSLRDALPSILQTPGQAAGVHFRWAKLCASVRGVSAGCPGETNALRKAEFPRQRAGSRSCGGDVYRLPLRPGPPRNDNKALGISLEKWGQTGRFQEGSGVSL